jgi:hypothetical protein
MITEKIKFQAVAGTLTLGLLASCFGLSWGIDRFVRPAAKKAFFDAVVSIEHSKKNADLRWKKNHDDAEQRFQQQRQ